MDMAKRITLRTLDLRRQFSCFNAYRLQFSDSMPSAKTVAILWRLLRQFRLSLFLCQINNNYYFFSIVVPIKMLIMNNVVYFANSFDHSLDDSANQPKLFPMFSLIIAFRAEDWSTRNKLNNDRINKKINKRPYGLSLIPWRGGKTSLCGHDWGLHAADSYNE